MNMPLNPPKKTQFTWFIEMSTSAVTRGKGGLAAVPNPAVRTGNHVELDVQRLFSLLERVQVRRMAPVRLGEVLIDVDDGYLGLGHGLFGLGLLSHFFCGRSCGSRHCAAGSERQHTSHATGANEEAPTRK